MSRLSPLQVRILRVLSAMSPPWRLTGGGALVGVHTKHRTTRDLDLFLSEVESLADTARQTEALLIADGLEVTHLATSPLHVRLLVSADGERIVVDLVADPVPAIDPPVEVEVSGITMVVDTPREILVNKLCALLSRSELRDIEDVLALQDLGVDLADAIESSPRKDAGFSPLTLAWTLRGVDVHTLGRVEGWTERRIEEVDAARHRLIDSILAAVNDPDTEQS